MNKTQINLIIGLALLGIITRVAFHLLNMGVNLEFITAIALSGGYFLKSPKLKYLPVLISLLISDALIGNTAIFIFTWSGFVLGPIIGSLLAKNTQYSLAQKTLGVQLGGIFSTLFFFLWTNLGVVLTSSMYPKTLAGLALSYTAGLPFLFNQLVGNLVIVPAIFLLVQLMHSAKLVTREQINLKS